MTTTGSTGYDIIGDIHGHADALRALLRQLGYRQHNGCFRHPERQAIFAGDFIDRGPDNLGVIDIVRRMVDGGAALAVMGNHEYNAICYHTRHPQTGQPLRPHSAKNTAQHAAFLAEFAGRESLLAETIAWFRSLPLFLELEGLRVIHAEWDARLIRSLTGNGSQPKNTFRLDEHFLFRSVDDRTSEHRVIETLLKGTEIPLPAGYVFQDKDGFARQEIRVKWWQASGRTYREIAMLPDDQLPAIPNLPLTDNGRNIYPTGEKPVFFGHYWMRPPVRLLTPNATCVDFSVARGGVLCGYRWNGERKLNPENLLFV